MTGMTYFEAAEHLTNNEPLFETMRTQIRGVNYTVFKNVPPSVPALLAFSRQAHHDGEAEYLIYEGERWTYDAFCDDVTKMAAALRSMGVCKGTPVAIATRNSPELLIMLMAISSAGAVAVFLNAWWTTKELEYALIDSGAQLVFADKLRCQRLDPLAEALGLNIVGMRDGDACTDLGYNKLRDNARAQPLPDVQIDPDDDFAIMYSSGTTGTPKGVVQTHRGAINAVFTWLMQAAMMPLMIPPSADAPAPPRPSALVITPLFHVTATHPMFLLSLPAGAKLTLMSKWDPVQAVHLIKSEAITRFMGVPTQSADLMLAARDMNEPLPSLDYLGSGGAKRPPAQVSAISRASPSGAGASRWLAPTSGTRPMPHSGIASKVRSVTTRCAPWAEMPTPPPITIPSISAT